MSNGSPYKITRRTKRLNSNQALSGYALDITIRANHEGAYFLQDHNSDRNTMPFTNVDDIRDFLDREIERNDQDFFGKP
jgi:hypothetical protein